jgi:hypothetical protein
MPLVLRLRLEGLARLLGLGLDVLLSQLLRVSVHLGPLRGGLVLLRGLLCLDQLDRGARVATGVELARGFRGTLESIGIEAGDGRVAAGAAPGGRIFGRHGRGEGFLLLPSAGAAEHCLFFGLLRSIEDDGMVPIGYCRTDDPGGVGMAQSGSAIMEVVGEV